MGPRARLGVAALLLGGIVISLPGQPGQAGPVAPTDVRISTNATPDTIGSRVAYSATSDTYLVVWEQDQEQDGQTEVFGSLVTRAQNGGDPTDQTGMSAGPSFLIASMGASMPGANAGAPAVTWSSSNNLFVVAYVGDTTTEVLPSVRAANEIYVRTVTTSGAVGTAARVSQMTNGDSDFSAGATQPAIAASNFGEAYVVWRGTTDGVTSPTKAEIWGQKIFVSTVPIEQGGDVQVSFTGAATDATLTVADPSIARVTLGYFVAWAGTPTAAGDWDIVGRMVDDTSAMSVPQRFEGSSDTVTATEAYRPDVVSTAGGLVVVWEGDRDTDDEFEVYGRRVDSVGGPLGSPTRFTHAGADGNRATTVGAPAIAYDAAANQLHVVWTADDVDFAGVVNDDVEVFGARFNATTLTPLDGPYRISDAGPDGQPNASVQTPDVAMSDESNRSALAVWSGADTNNASPTAAGLNAVWGQRIGVPTDLSVVVTPTTYLTPMPGETVGFTIAYANAGPTEVKDARITATLPALDNLQISATGSPPPTPTNAFPMTFSTLPVGASGTITVTGTVPVAAANGQQLVATTQIRADTVYDEADLPDDTGTVTFTVDTPPAVTINRAMMPTQQPDPTNASPIRFTVEFDEPVLGLMPDDIDLSASTTGGALVPSISGSGPVYTVSVSGMAGPGDVIASIAAGRVTDANTHPNLASTSADNSIAFDNQPPTVTVNRRTAVTNQSPIVFDVVFSEPVVGFDAGDVNLGDSTTGGTLVPTVDGTGPAYTVGVTGMAGDGAVSASLAAGAAADPAGNPSAASTGANVVQYDTAGPGVTINQAAGQTDPTAASSVEFTVVFSEAVTDFTASDVTITPTGVTTGTPTITGSGATYTVAVPGVSGSGTVVATIGSGAASDAIGNPSTASSSIDNSVTVDRVAPGASIALAAGQPNPTNGSTVTFTVTFSEPVTDFDDPTDVALVLNGVTGTVTGVTGTGDTYTVTVSGVSGTGSIQASVVAGAAQDPVGNLSTASGTATVNVDATAPTVTVDQAAGQADPATAGPVVFDVVFSEPVTGFTPSGVSFAGSAVSGSLVAAIDGSGTTYTVSVSGMTGDGVVVVSLDPGAAVDAASNGSAASTSTDNSITLDATAPTVTVNQAAGQADPTNGTTAEFTVVFSEPVTDFDVGDVTIGLSGLTAGTPTIGGSGTTYTVTVPGLGGNGTVTASLAAGVAHDAATNPSAASTSTDNTVAVDQLAPSAAIALAAGQPNPTNGSSVTFTVTFSEPVSGFDSSDVALTHAGTTGTVTNVTGMLDTYTVTVTGVGGNGSIQASVLGAAAEDAARNDSTASGAATVTIDTAAPTVTIDQSAGQNDPTNTGPVTFTVHFSEPVTGFGAGDLSIATTGSAAGAPQVSGAGADYTVTFPTVSGDGTITLGVLASAASDGAGNNSLTSTSTDNTVTIDTTAPTVTIDQAAGPPPQIDPTNAGPIRFDVHFSEPVTGFAGGDVVLATTGTAAGNVTGITGSGAEYVVTVGNVGGDGTISATVSAGAADDLAGNASAASTSADNTVTVDSTVPTVTIDRSAGQADPTNAGPVTFDVVFSEPVTGFDAGDVAVAGTGTLTFDPPTVSGTGPAYTVTVGGLAGTGDLSATIVAGGALDSSLNGNDGSTSADNTVHVDRDAPTVTIDQAPGQADPTAATSVDFAVHFSEPVTGFEPADVIVTGAPAAAASVVVTGSDGDYTVRLANLSGGGIVSAAVSSMAAVDVAGNGNGASTSTDNEITIDQTGPAVTIDQSATQVDPVTDGSPVRFTVVFDEAVTGFDAADVTVGGTAGASGVTVTGAGATYEVTVGDIPHEGTVVATVNANAVSDALGTPSAASTSTDNTVTVVDLGDPVAPPVTDPDPVGEGGGTTITLPVDGTDGSTVTDVSPTSANGGTVTVNPDGTVTYTPPPGYAGPDSFTYTVCDNDTPPTCDEGTVEVWVADAGNPVANPDAISVVPGTPVTVDVLANDLVLDGARISRVFFQSSGAAVTLSTSRTHAVGVQGSVQLNPDSTVTYSPGSGFVGTEVFGYEICDNDLPTPTCSQALVTATLVQLPATGGGSGILPIALWTTALGLAALALTIRRRPRLTR